MTLRIKLASSTEEVDQVFQVRHRVFVGDGYMDPEPDGRVVDRFDAYPGTVNFAVFWNERVVGAIRFTEHDESVGVAADEFFDFSEYLPKDAHHGSLSMLCLEKEFRGQKRLFVGMIGMGTYWAKSRGVTCLRAATNPEIEKQLLRIGFKSVAPPFFHEDLKLSVVPMLLSIDDLSDAFVDFVHKQHLDEVIDSFERCFYDEGEVILQRGDPGHEAFIIVDGKVGIIWSEEGTVNAVLERGALFGEIELFTDRPRIATVVALDDVCVMVIERSVFLQRLEQYPKIARDLLTLITNRLAEVVAGSDEKPE